MDTVNEKPPILPDVLISPFNKLRLYKQFDLHGFDKSEQVIAFLKKQCEEDPAQFSVEYGEEMATMLIEAKWD